MEVKEVVHTKWPSWCSHLLTFIYVRLSFLGDKRLFNGYAFGLVQWQSILTRFNAY